MRQYFPGLLALALMGCSSGTDIGAEQQNAEKKQIETIEPGAFSPSFGKLGEGDVVNFPGHQVLHHVKASDLPSEISLTELTLAPKMLGAPPHIHQEEDEIFIVLTGRVHFLNGSEEVVGQAGTIATLPRGHFHGFWNPYEEPVTLLLMIAPGHFEAFFADVEAAVKDGGPKSPPEVGAIIAQKAADRNVTVDMSRLPPSALALLGPPPQ